MDYWNRKVRRLTIIDLKLIQVGSMAGILVVVKLFPEIMSLSIWCFVALLVICAMRPFYVFWLEEDDAGQQPAANGPSSDGVAFLENSPARQGGVGCGDIPGTPPSRAGLATNAIAGTCSSTNPNVLAAESPVGLPNNTGEKEMDPLEEWLNFCNQQVKKFSFFDVKLIQLCGVFLGIAAVKLFPSILQLGLWQLVSMALLCAAKPTLVFFFSTDDQRKSTSERS
jgi:hypothetical protein